MTMSPADIIAHAHNIQANNIANMVVYYFAPIDDQTTQLININNQIYNIPTNKLSDIHAILSIRHPTKNYYIRYRYNNIHNNLFVIHSQAQYPNVIDIQQTNNRLNGYYTINTHNIGPVNCDNISIREALNIIHAQMQAQCDFMRLHPDATYSFTDCTDKIYLFNSPNIYTQYCVYNVQHSPDIIVDNNIYNKQQIYRLHYTNFSIKPDAIDNIDAAITDTCRNILDHIYHYPEGYWNTQGSQHQRIALLRAAEHYFAQPDNSLRVSIRQAVRNLQEHYTYQE